MKYFKTDKITDHQYCCNDVGDIVKVTSLSFSQGSGFGHLYLMDKHYRMSNKALAVLAIGFILLKDDDGKYIPCNDPRVLYMYLWPFWKHHIGRDDKDPPIPTMEEALSWQSKAGITTEPNSKGKYTKATTEYFGFYF